MTDSAAAVARPFLGLPEMAEFVNHAAGHVRYHGGHDIVELRLAPDYLRWLLTEEGQSFATIAEGFARLVGEAGRLPTIIEGPPPPGFVMSARWRCERHAEPPDWYHGGCPWGVLTLVEQLPDDGGPFVRVRGFCAQGNTPAELDRWESEGPPPAVLQGPC